MLQMSATSEVGMNCSFQQIKCVLATCCILNRLKTKIFPQTYLVCVCAYIYIYTTLNSEEEM